jgi:hypothetical protein
MTTAKEFAEDGIPAITSSLDQACHQLAHLKASLEKAIFSGAPGAIDHVNRGVAGRGPADCRPTIAWSTKLPSLLQLLGAHAVAGIVSVQNCERYVQPRRLSRTAVSS